MANGENIIPINIEDEMKGAYIDYSMSVIISRALPDVKDGLKPVHRRILYGMAELGVNYNKPYKKSARIVGEVLGKYHPHGDSAVYDTMVRMAQSWSMRYMLVDGQGNFGSMDGDSPAAMRYTEARLRRMAEELLSDINKETVDFQNNFDDSLREPKVLPAKVPNLLVNGASGIAVGMATNMAPHNLSEVVDGINAYIDNNDITIEELMQYIQAPDFPTGGIIYGYQGVKSALETGRGRVVLRAKAEVEETKSGKDLIVVTEVPYQVNKAAMIEKTAALVNEKKIEGISNVNDESDRNGMRIVYELKKDAIPNIVLNNLYKYTQLQTSFGVNNVALVNGRPMTLNLKDIIKYYVQHRHDVVIKRAQYDLREAEKRAHILEGYMIALASEDVTDQIIDVIRKSKDPETARNQLMSGFELSEIQARAILDLRLQRLTALEIDKIRKEYEEIKAIIDDLKETLESEPKRMGIIKDELTEMKERYGDARRTTIEHSADEFTMEDMIPDEEMVISITHQGYAKRTPLAEYRTQGRGGVGSRGVKTKEDDYTEHLFVATTHNYLLVFTDKGKVYWLKVYSIPEGTKTSKGRPLQNLINIEMGERVQAVINVKSLSDPDYVNNHFLIMATERGTIKKTPLEAYSRPRTNGINAISINDGDALWDVRLTDGNSDVILAVKSGRAIRFNENAVRSMGRNATGVRGISLDDEKDRVIGLVTVHEGDEVDLLVVSEHGYGKKSALQDYRITNRGGKGVKTLNLTDKTGPMITMKAVTETDGIMIINKSGIVIRLDVSTLRIMGRATQGVRLIKLGKKDEVAAVATVPGIAKDEEEMMQPEEGTSSEGESEPDNE